MPVETIDGHLYDFPHYYDIVFGVDWQDELRFLERCFTQHAAGPVRSLFEPACGTGRLVYRLAKAGYKIGGLDLNEKSVDYCNARLKRLHFPQSVFVGDMSNFQLKKPVDAAFNMINSVRHLLTEEAAVAHFTCMAQAVRPGGLYIVGLHLSPTLGSPIDEESWEAKRGGVTVRTKMWTVERDLRKRLERCALEVRVDTPRRKIRIQDELHFRTYNWQQLKRVIEVAGAWEIVAVYDFSYQTNNSFIPNARTEDIIPVLRRVK
jgi:SAM-dependent methyltransferase